MCNKDTEQVTEEEMLLRHDRRLFEEGLSGYVTFDVLNGDPLACVFTLEHRWNMNRTTDSHTTTSYINTSVYDLDISSKQMKYRLLFLVSKAITSEVMASSMFYLVGSSNRAC